MTVREAVEYLIDNMEDAECLTVKALENYANGILPDDLAVAVEAHLIECERCKSMLEIIDEEAYKDLPYYRQNKRKDSLSVKETMLKSSGRLKRALLIKRDYNNLLKLIIKSIFDQINILNMQEINVTDTTNKNLNITEIGIIDLDISSMMDEIIPKTLKDITDNQTKDIQMIKNELSKPTNITTTNSFRKQCYRIADLIDKVSNMKLPGSNTVNLIFLPAIFALGIHAYDFIVRTYLASKQMETKNIDCVEKTPSSYRFEKMGVSMYISSLINKLNLEPNIAHIVTDELIILGSYYFMVNVKNSYQIAT